MIVPMAQVPIDGLNSLSLVWPQGYRAGNGGGDCHRGASRAIASKFLTAISTLPAGLRSRNDQIAARAYLRFLRARAGSPD
jgi:hypothetical protein